MTTPIYELGVQGVFTKELDVMLLTNQADVAVHSLKDVPIVPAKGLTVAAVLERGPWRDVLIYKNDLPGNVAPFTVATSSVRRKAQWLQRYANHQTVTVRGNVQTRIRKFNESAWDGLLMAGAAIERLNLKEIRTIALDWMLPAPAQGAIGIACREEDDEVIQILKSINHPKTFQEVTAERQFLHELKGGCSAPISALAVLQQDQLNFHGAIHSLDGSEWIEVKKKFGKKDYGKAGNLAAHEVLQTEKGQRILKEIFSNRPDFTI